MNEATATATAAARLIVTAIATLPGNLFEWIGPEGDLYHFYHVFTVVTVEDGREFIHPFAPFGRQADWQVEEFQAKVKARGSIDPILWDLYDRGPSLEERLREESILEDQVRRGVRWDPSRA